MVLFAASTVGFLPPTVTVTVSTDILPLPASITSSPHFAVVAVVPAYCTCCCTAQFGKPLGTLPVICKSPQFTPVSAWATPSLPTSATEQGPVPEALTLEQVPKW